MCNPSRGARSGCVRGEVPSLAWGATNSWCWSKGLNSREGAASRRAGRQYGHAGRPMFQGMTLRLTASIGIAMFPHDGEDVETLMKNADIAMYGAKEHGRNGFRFYEPTWARSYRRMLMMQQGLNDALTREELSLDYQPRIRRWRPPRDRCRSAPAMEPSAPGRGTSGRIHSGRRNAPGKSSRSASGSCARYAGT